jgi:IS30 family transposase
MIRSYRGTISRELDRIKNPTKVYSAQDIPEEIRKKLEEREKKKETGNGESFKTPSFQSAK